MHQGSAVRFVQGWRFASAAAVSVYKKPFNTRRRTPVARSNEERWQLPAMAATTFSTTQSPFVSHCCISASATNRSVALYYCGETALSLRCFRLALVLRHKLLRTKDQDIQEREEGEPASEAGEGWKQAPCNETQEDTVAAEAEGTAAALTLSNFAVCLAGTGDTIAAAQALAISSAMTT